MRTRSDARRRAHSGVLRDRASTAVTYLEAIFERLNRAASVPVLGEVREGKIVSVSGAELLALVQKARRFILGRGLKPGDQCALYAPNSIRWVAADLALMAEGVVVIPLDPRQVASEIAAVVCDAAPSAIFCSDAEFAANLPVGMEPVFFDAIFAGNDVATTPPLARANDDAATIVYTSGTSGEQKGVVLTVG